MPPMLLPAAARPYDVVALGENSLDLVAQVDEWPEPDTKTRLRSLEWLPGGQMVTAAIAAARLGMRTRYCGVVGDDEWGAQVADAARQHVDATFVACAGAATRSALVLVDARGRRTVLERRDSRLQLAAADVPAGWVESGRVLMIDATLPEAALSAADRAHRANLPVVLDIDDAGDAAAALLRASDVVIASSGFPRAFTGRPTLESAMRAMDDAFGPALLIVTRGADGATACWRGQTISVPAFPIDAVDTTGAGDAFRGGFVASWLTLGDSAPVAALLQRAAIVAALNCRATGAQTALPTRAELEACL